MILVADYHGALHFGSSAKHAVAFFGEATPSSRRALPRLSPAISACRGFWPSKGCPVCRRFARQAHKAALASPKSCATLGCRPGQPVPMPALWTVSYICCGQFVGLVLSLFSLCTPAPGIALLAKCPLVGGKINIAFAQEAHKLGLAVSLKNDLDQI